MFNHTAQHNLYSATAASGTLFAAERSTAQFIISIITTIRLS